MLTLFYAAGACSLGAHIVLEESGEKYDARKMDLSKGEQRTPEYLALNPNAQVPVLVADGKPLTQILAICEFLDLTFPEAALLPKGAWERAQALSQLAWMNSTPHTTMTRWFFPERYAESEGARGEIKQRAAQDFRAHLGRLQDMVPQMRGALHEAYAFTLLRWGGFAGVDPRSLPQLRACVEKAMQGDAFKAALARERIALDTYKG